MRLNKALAQTTHLSRRHADEAILCGEVTINGHTAKLGQKINPSSDQVKYKGKLLNVQPKQHEYFLFHKPKGYITAKSDPEGKPTIYDILPKKLHHLNPVGRLDLNTSGLLILTNDGPFIQKMAHPSFQIKKMYEAKIRGVLPEKLIERIKRGIRLEDGLARFENLQLMRVVGKNSWFRVTVTEGRNRLIRRVFDQVGFSVVKLKRLQMGHYCLNKLPIGVYQPFRP
ncbi:MAG: rRNA pseudouridine synthase [Deltaproteobacteria bacterium]|nr:rRNA pseudouridine synthase [Deltaproteobacteria bacterium]